MVKINVSKVAVKHKWGFKKIKTTPPNSIRSYQATIPTKQRNVLERIHQTREDMHAKMRELRNLSPGPEHKTLQTKIAVLQDREKMLQLLLQPAN